MTNNFHTPRKYVVIENWPSGRDRVTAVFEVEKTKRGERVCRTTTGKPKKTTYCDQFVIATNGDDNKTYLLGLCQNMNAIVIVPGTMQTGLEYLWPSDPQFNEIKTLIESAPTAK